MTRAATSLGAPASVPEIRIGAVSFLHRFGYSLNAHFHCHDLLDESPEVDLTEAEPEPAFDFDPSGPEFEFDQSLPDSVDG